MTCITQLSRDCDIAIVIGSTLTNLIRSRSNIVLVILRLSSIVSVKHLTVHFTLVTGQGTSGV